MVVGGRMSENWGWSVGLGYLVRYDGRVKDLRAWRRLATYSPTTRDSAVRPGKTKEAVSGRRRFCPATIRPRMEEMVQHSGR